MKNISENKLNDIIRNTINKVIKESIFDNEMVTFILISRANGNVKIHVPYREFIKTKNKFDYLWQKCIEQNEINLVRNGYFIVDPKDPHREEIEKYV